MNPRPYWAAIISPATSENHAAPIAIWKPVKIDGSAPGTMMSTRTSRGVAPRQRAARKKSGSIERTPSSVFMVVAKNATSEVTKMTAGSSPGKMRMAMGTQASGGMGRSSPSRAEANSLMRTRHPMRMPSGTPSTTASANEVNAR